MKDLISYEEGSIANLDLAHTDNMKFVLMAFAARGYKKAFVCSDPDLIKFGVTKKVTDLLDAANFAYSVYSEIKPNPTIANVQDGVAAFKAAEADCIVTIGGGGMGQCIHTGGSGQALGHGGHHIGVHHGDFRDVVGVHADELALLLHIGDDVVDGDLGSSAGGNFTLQSF